jgi:ABC-2 type transport system permease protein
MTVTAADAPAETVAPAGAPRAGGPRRPGRVNWRGMATLARRELTRFRRMALAFVLAPSFFAVIFFTAFRFSLGDHRNTPEGLAMLDYLMPGLVMMAVVFRTVENTGLSLLSAKLDGTITDLLMAPLGAVETVAAYAVWGTLAGLITGAAVLAAAELVWPLPIRHVWAVLLFGAGAALLMTLLGTLFGLVSAKFEHIGAFFNFLLVPTSFLSGLFSAIDGYPAPVRFAIQLNPVFHAVDGFRYGFLGRSTLPVEVSATALLGIDAALAALLVVLFGRGWRLRA